VLEGLDCSYYQGQISWAKVAKAGKRFAIIRSGDGKFLDPKFGPYIRGALDNGLHVTIYHYLRFGLDPESHADLCARRLQEAQELGARDFLWLDWEDTSAHCKAMTVLQRQWWASEFLDSLEKNNDVSTYGHYTGMWWFNPYLGHPDIILPYLARQFFSHPLWIGQYPYGAQSDPTAAGWKPTLPGGWPDWAVWQYTSSGRVDGIEGNVDLDIAREGFLDLKEGDMTQDWHARRWPSGLLRQVAGHAEAAAGLVDHAWSGTEYAELEHEVRAAAEKLDKARQILRDNGLGPETGDWKVDTF